MDQVKIVEKYKSREQTQKPTLKERNVVLSEYLQHRSTEMEIFQNYLEVKDRVSNKMHFQTLGKHLKRRAMSHNRYRVPSRIRKLHDNQSRQSTGQTQQKQYLLNNNLKSKICRKHLRKPVLLQKLYQFRNSHSKWLDSHLYLTKRMVMQQYYGYQVAITHNTKQNRAAYNQFYKNGAVVYDRSYYQILEIKSDPNKLFQVLGNQFKQIIMNDEQIQKGQKMFRFELFNNGQLVGPVQSVIVPFQNVNHKIKLWLIIHPCIKQECICILNDNKCCEFEWNDLSDQFNIYDLKGKYVMDKLASLIRQISEVGDRYEQLINMFEQIHDVEQYQINQIYHFNMKGQIQNRIIQQPNYRYQIQQDLEDIQDINQQIVELQNYKQQIEQYDVQIFNEQDNQQFKSMFIKRFIVVQRSRYTHKKKQTEKIEIQKKLNQNKEQIKVKKKIKKVIKTENKQESKDKQIEDQKAIEDGVYQFNQLKQQIIDKNKELEKQVVLMLMLDNQDPENKGVSMIFPIGNGNKIIRYLNYHNCKLTGLNQINKIQQEAEQLIFPNDFISTQSYKTHIQDKAQKQKQIYDRKPKNRRVDYERLKCFHPFEPDWSIFNPQYLRRVKLRMISRGIPKSNAMICRLKEQDYSEIQQQYSIGDYKTLSHVHQESSVSQNSEMDRQIIGYVTTGDFSFETQKGKAIGFVSYQNLQKINRFLVLIRNTQSRFYFVAEAHIY